MTAVLCLLVGIAALVLAVVLPDQRLYLGLLAVVAGAAAVALAPARRDAARQPEDHAAATEPPDADPPVVAVHE